MSVAFNHAVAVLIDGDRFEEAAGPLEAAVALAREQGSLSGLATLTGLRAVMAWRAGTLLEAEALSREILQMVNDSGSSALGVQYWAYVGAVLVERSELERAEDAIANTQVRAGLPTGTYAGMPFVAGARLRLAQGRPDDALADLLELRSASRPWAQAHALPMALRRGQGRTRARRPAAGGPAGRRAARADPRWDTPSAMEIALCSQGLVTGGAGA